MATKKIINPKDDLRKITNKEKEFNLITSFGDGM